MTWGFTLWGPAPSVNKSYKITKQFRTTATGERVAYSTLSKRAEVVEYQTKAVLVIRAAKPSGWKPEGWVHITFKCFMTRHGDLDNLAKSLLDAIQMATGVNDKWYVPCFTDPVVGVSPQEARVEVTID